MLNETQTEDNGAAPVDPMDDQPTVRINLETAPGRISAQRMAQIVTRGWRAILGGGL